MNAIDTLRTHIVTDGLVVPPEDATAALAKLETLLQAAETVAAWDGTGRARLDALAAAVRDAKGAS